MLLKGDKSVEKRIYRSESNFSENPGGRGIPCLLVSTILERAVGWTAESGVWRHKVVIIGISTIFYNQRQVNKQLKKEMPTMDIFPFQLNVVRFGNLSFRWIVENSNYKLIELKCRYLYFLLTPINHIPVSSVTYDFEQGLDNVPLVKFIGGSF